MPETLRPKHHLKTFDSSHTISEFQDHRFSFFFSFCPVCKNKTYSYILQCITVSSGGKTESVLAFLLGCVLISLLPPLVPPPPLFNAHPQELKNFPVLPTPHSHFGSSAISPSASPGRGGFRGAFRIFSISLTFPLVFIMNVSKHTSYTEHSTVASPLPTGTSNGHFHFSLLFHPSSVPRPFFFWVGWGV